MGRCSAPIKHDEITDALTRMTGNLEAKSLGWGLQRSIDRVLARS